MVSQDFFVSLTISQYLSACRRTKQDMSCRGKCEKSASLVIACCLVDTSSLYLSKSNNKAKEEIN